MDAVFTGIVTNKVDRAGRVSIPPSFRDRLEERDPEFHTEQKTRVVICYDEVDADNRYLEGMAVSDWLKMRALIESAPYGPARDAMMHRYVIRAQVLPLDENGRIVLKKHPREVLNLTGEVVFTGRLDQFHITAPDVATAADQDRAAWLRENVGASDPRALLNSIRGGQA